MMEEDEKREYNEEAIEEYIQYQKEILKSRKTVQEILFFASCQVASASIAIFMYQYALSVVFTSWLCFTVASLPSLTGFSECRIRKNENGWEFEIMNRPFVILFKFVSGAAMTYLSIIQLADQITKTDQALQEIRIAIQQNERPRIENYMPPFHGQAFIAAIAIMLIFLGLKMMKNNNPFD